jgi:glycosyltransferase involved in cell wall biosynthesis
LDLENSESPQKQGRLLSSLLTGNRTKSFEREKAFMKTEKIIQENNLNDNVKIPDTFTTLEKIYNLADVPIFPVENMQGKFDVPLVVVEAMACEKPVIISDLKIFEEFANEQNSVKIEAGNMDQLFEKILDVQENKSNYIEIGKNARKFAAENFDIKKTAEKYQTVYDNI